MKLSELKTSAPVASASSTKSEAFPEGNDGNTGAEELNRGAANPPIPVGQPDEPAVQSGEPAATGVDGDGAEGDVQQSTSPSDEPWGVAQSVTPSGLEVYYQAGPKRLYRVRDTDPDAGSDDREWFEVPSVSTVLDCLEKGGLSFWGNKVGVDGVLELVSLGHLVWVDDE